MTKTTPPRVNILDALPELAAHLKRMPPPIALILSILFRQTWHEPP